jgi:hypothetical protein
VGDGSPPVAARGWATGDVVHERGYAAGTAYGRKRALSHMVFLNE